jgi:hypothetical protein
MDPETQQLPLAEATAAARRLLVHAIDLRFDLDAAAEAAGGSGLHRADVQRLRAAAVSIREEIDRLSAALEPDVHVSGEILEEEQDEVSISPVS